MYIEIYLPSPLFISIYNIWTMLCIKCIMIKYCLLFHYCHQFVILLTWCQIAKFLRLLKSYESRNRNFNKLTLYRLIRNWIYPVFKHQFLFFMYTCKMMVSPNCIRSWFWRLGSYRNDAGKERSSRQTFIEYVLSMKLFPSSADKIDLLLSHARARKTNIAIYNRNVQR